MRESILQIIFVMYHLGVNNSTDVITDKVRREPLPAPVLMPDRCSKPTGTNSAL
jgi:hypothetical protein